jgi:hypothetical protein
VDLFSALVVVVERGKIAKAATHPNLAKFPAKRKKTTRHEIFERSSSRITVVYSLTIREDRQLSAVNRIISVK